MNNKYEFLAGIFYIILMFIFIITGICGLLFGQNRTDIILLGIFLIIVPTIDLTRRFTIAWICVKMEEENDKDNENEIK